MKFYPFNIFKILVGEKKHRNLEIDTLRGIACLFLVAYHVVGNDVHAGLKISTGFLREGNDLLAFFRMPLFTFLSGYVYAYRPFKSGVLAFLKVKSRRLLIPVLVVGGIFALMQMAIPGVNKTIPSWHYFVLLKPYAHFWFAESLFIIYLIVIPLEILKLWTRKRYIIITFILASLLYISNITMIWFSISGAIYLFPYFILGMFICRFSIVNKWHRFWGCLLILVVSIVLVTLINTELMSLKRMLFPLVIGLCGCLGLLITRIKIIWLAAIGQYSYAIYLYHVFFTAGMRIILKKLGINSQLILFNSGLIIGILGPIVVYLLFSKVSFLRVVFLGEKKLN
jgi:peptidoglycan/LPS O-acetylase OafA/YrhL